MAVDTKKFRNLVLDRSKLPEWIQSATSEYLDNFTISEINLISKKSNQYRVEISGDDKPIFIDFYFKNDDTTTIYPNTGPNQEKGLLIGERILGFLDFRENDNQAISHSIQPVDRGDFALIIEYLSGMVENDGAVLLKQARNEASKSDLFQYRSRLGDKITLTYYDNKRFQIQGKAQYLYNEITSLMAGFVSFEEMVKQHSVFFNTDLSPQETRDEMKLLLPNSYGDLDDTLKSILSPSIALQHIDVVLDDYSCFAFPALRGLEGYIKIILGDNGIFIPSKGNIGVNYREKSLGVYELNSVSKTTIVDVDVINNLEKMYNYYYANRHGLFHANQVILSTRLIETRQEAQQIISDVIKLIEDAHTVTIGN